MKTSVSPDFECCPRFNPKPWDDVVLEWNDKQFVKASVCTIAFMPLNFGMVIRKLFKAIEKAGATAQDYLCLSDHTSKWNMDIYIAVDKSVPGVENKLLSGTFYSRVYEGPFRDTDKWCRDFQAKAAEKELHVDKWYMWYTTCPKCAKKYGENYVAVIAKVDRKD
ncbi:MAG: hydrolase [Bacteroidales bacterium]|jgi:hypothetical protein|nr:hypothetical protein [Bacteroidales bacterium]MDD4655613.1 hypothetical protein [Bacteroidales bacterium]